MVHCSSISRSTGSLLDESNSQGERGSPDLWYAPSLLLMYGILNAGKIPVGGGKGALQHR